LFKKSAIRGSVKEKGEEFQRSWKRYPIKPRCAPVDGKNNNIEGEKGPPGQKRSAVKGINGLLRFKKVDEVGTLLGPRKAGQGTFLRG